MIEQASAILATPLGSLVYHLLLLLMIEAALAMAWGEWRRARRGQAQRLVVAMVGLMAVRIVYLLAALWAALGWVEGWVLLPPLERFADTASIAFLGWAFMPPIRGRVRVWDMVFGINLLLTVVACVVFTILWSQSGSVLGVPPDYNGSWQASVWTLWQMGLIILASVSVVQDRGMGWGIFLAAMLVMFVGRLLQLLSPMGPTQLAGWERLSNLVAYPLIVAAVYQDIVVGLRVHSRELQDISQASLDQIKSLLFLFDASQQMSSSLDLSTVLDNAVEGIARALEADLCAIAFPEEMEPGVMRFVAIYNPARQGRGEGVTFPLEYQLLVQQAIRRKKYVIAEEMDNVQLKVLFALLGSSEVGPLLVQPLVADETVIGAIIAGNSRSRRPFTPNEAKLCQSMAEQVVGAILNSRHYQAAETKIADLTQAVAKEHGAVEAARAQLDELKELQAGHQGEAEALRQKEKFAREARNALEIKLVSSRAEADALSNRLSILETDLAQTHANSDAQTRWYEEELARFQSEWQQANQSTEWSQSVLYGLTAGIIVADADGIVQEANVAADILLEQDNGALQHRDLRGISDDERWQHAVATASKGEAVRLTMQIGANTLMCDVAPLPDLEAPQGQLKGIVVLLQDISAESGLQQERLELVGAMAQELRTPLTTIVNYVDLLLSEAVGPLEDGQRRFLLRVKASVERMGQMTEDLTSEANGEEQWISPRRQQVDLGRFITTTVNGASLHVEDRGLTLNMVLSEDLPRIWADPDYLRRVLTNLVANACLASPAGGEINVQALQSNGLSPHRESLALDGEGFVIVSVSDTGGGLSDEALDRVFDQARPSQTPQGLGESGAGLALVKMLVEAHGGRLWVETESGVGTTFSFVLPVEQRMGVLVADEMGALSAEGTAA